jgi:hypothetical protein
MAKIGLRVYRQKSPLTLAMVCRTCIWKVLQEGKAKEDTLARTGWQQVEHPPESGSFFTKIGFLTEADPMRGWKLLRLRRQLCFKMVFLLIILITLLALDGRLDLRPQLVRWFDFDAREQLTRRFRDRLQISKQGTAKIAALHVLVLSYAAACSDDFGQLRLELCAAHFAGIIGHGRASC